MIETYRVERSNAANIKYSKAGGTWFSVYAAIKWLKFKTILD
jgi:hypothetical protein